MLVKMCLLIISQKKDSSRNDWSFLLEVHTLILYFFYGSFRNASFFLFILQSVSPPPMLRANKLERKYSIGTILASLSKAECSLIQQNYYLFDYYDEVLKDIGKNMDIDFGKRIRTLGEIKKILAKTKKAEKTP